MSNVLKKYINRVDKSKYYIGTKHTVVGRRRDGLKMGLGDFKEGEVVKVVYVDSANDRECYTECDFYKKNKTCIEYTSVDEEEDYYERFIWSCRVIVDTERR